MADKTTYFAIIDDHATSERPGGLLRRIELESGGIRDEGLRKDMSWQRTGSIVEWKHGDYLAELEEVSEEAAQRIIEDLRVRWGALS